MEEIRNDVLEENMKINNEIKDEKFFDDFDDIGEPKQSILEKTKNFSKSLIGRAGNVVKQIRENPEEAIENAGKIGTVLAIGGSIVYSLKKADKINRTVYSDEIGECVELNRKLNNEDMVEIDYRMSTGQTKIKALDDMNLVKHKK